MNNTRLGVYLFVLAVFAGTALAQDEVIRVKTDLITVPVSVLDRNGRYVTDLQRQDFALFENGSEQSIEYFGSVDSPVTVLLLLDASSSMSRHMDKLAAAATSFALNLRANDHVIVAVFGEKVETVLPKTSRSNLPKILELKTLIGRETHIYDAVSAGLGSINDISGRKAIVLFTDGLNDGGIATSEDNLREVEEGEALVYTVRFGRAYKPSVDSILAATQPAELGTGKSSDPGFFDRVRATEKLEKQVSGYLSGLAEKSGGRSYRIEDIKDLDKTFGNITAELSRQYSLGYYLKSPLSENETRKLTVKIRSKDVVVRARKEIAFRKQAR